MHRRGYLSGMATLGVTGVAGCSGLTDTNPNVVLPEPERSFESADVPYPAWGERIPDVTVPAPLEDRQVALRAVNRPRLLTFIYTSCPSICPVLTSRMRNVQTHALNNGYGDGVEFFATTFDPARDTADRFRQYASRMNVDADAGNWHFLRPRSKTRAKQVVQQRFGVSFSKRDQHPDEQGYMFNHTPLTLLVNADDYVERAYRTKSPNAERMIADLETVRTA